MKDFSFVRVIDMRGPVPSHFRPVAASVETLDTSVRRIRRALAAIGIKASPAEIGFMLAIAMTSATGRCTTVEYALEVDR
jgi:hypothetical protein